MILTDAEHAYMAGHPLGRLATIGPDGAPQSHPVAFWLNDGTGTIDIGGPALTRSQKFRNVQADPRVSFVVDDQAGTPNPIGQTGRGIEIRGQAEIVILDLVGAENPVTSCDLRIFANHPAEPISAQNAHTGHFSRRLDAPGGRVLLQ